MRKFTQILWGLLLLLFTGLGIFLLALFSQPFAQARRLADRLSKDGSLDSFSLPFYHTFRLPMLALACLLILAAVAMMIGRKRALRWIAVGLSFPKRFWLEGRAFLDDIRAGIPGRFEAMRLSGLMILAIIARAPFLMRPYYHDEAYTVVVFVIAPFREFIADYHHPNNHIFHTILVHLAYLVWGIQPWAMRLPAMIAGVLCVPAIYFLARRLYNPSVATLSAAGVAVLPILVNFSTAARGYTLIMLFSILTFLLADYARRKANLAAWGCLILCSTLGLYTIPVFLAPFGAVMLWLFLSMLVGDFGDVYTRQKLFGWLVVAGLCVLLLTLLLYMPVFLHSGVRSMLEPQITQPMSWRDFLDGMHSRIQDHALELMTELSPIFGWVIGIGFCLSLVFAVFPKLSPGFEPLKIPHQLSVLGWTLGFYTMLRVPPESRLIVFLVPYWLMWASVGWVGLLAILSRAPRRINPPTLFSGLVVLVAVLGTGWRLASNPQANYYYRGSIENVALFLKTQIRDKDLIVVASPDDADIWYYSRLHGINPDHFKRELPFFRAFILVDSTFGQTFESVMKARGPESFFFDYKTAKVVFQSGSLQVVEIIPYLDLIRSQYHLP